jgi:hypothetical protein
VTWSVGALYLPLRFGLTFAPGPDGAGAADALVTACPYRGLSVFDEADTQFFFGREAIYPFGALSKKGYLLSPFIPEDIVVTVRVKEG